MARASVPIDREHAATPAETREYLVGGQRRLTTPIANCFLQEFGGTRDPGPLHWFVQSRRALALRLYLLLHCIPLTGPWDKRLPNGAWARAIGLTGAGAESTASRNWGWLRDRRLVSTGRDHRVLVVTLRREDGSGVEYTRPSRYFRLPIAYAVDGWIEKLDLAETVALLIALHRGRAGGWCDMRREEASRWYGISADTLSDGLVGLQEHGLIEMRLQPVKDAAARYGVTRVSQFQLLGPFATGKSVGKDGDA